MKIILSAILVFLSVFVIGQTSLNELNLESYLNHASSHNYTYWNQNWKTSTGQDRQFSNQASKYAFQVNYNALNMENLILNDQAWDTEQAFEALDDSIFNAAYSANIDYAILHTGLNNFTKGASPTNMGNKDSQMAEYGTWCNRRFISTNFTNNPSIETYFTGIEFATWHNRWKMTLHVRPTAAIINGQLQLSFTMPTAYAQYFTDNTHHAFGLDAQKGFVIKTEDAGTSLSVSGNTITVLTGAQNLNPGESYEVSLIFKPMLQNLSTDFASAFDEEGPATLNVNQSLPAVQNLNTNATYSATEGMHIIDLPRYVMGQYNCNTDGVMQQVDFSVANTSSITKRVRLCFRQIPNVNVTGFNSLLCHQNGDPSGLPIQVSKNWHAGTAQLFSGAWIKEYTEVIVPPNTTLNLVYRRTGALWGETYAASSHQLSVVGAGVPRGGWLEAALGSYGESITHSPDVEYGNSNGCDVRPFLVTNGNYGGTSTPCNWTGNVGGLDFWLYADGNNNRQYQSEVKTHFNRYSPNLTETTVGAVSADKKLKLEYTFYLNRSDDYTRIYYKVKIKALDTVNFNRFDFFQLGGDTYNHHNTQAVAIGNDTGVLAQFLPTNSGSNDYTTAAMALTGNDPWIWAGDGFSYGNLSGGLAINTNNGLIIRDYQATLNGQASNTPYFRERSSSQGFSAQYNTNPTSYCLVPPPSVTSFHPGDEVEMLLEVAILPKTNGDYYGPNQNFQTALALHQNTYNLFMREVSANQVVASSPTHAISSDYPITVATQNNEALVQLEGGLGYVPLVFSGLDNVNNPILWRAVDSCWELVDQSVHGKDFWQADYNSANQNFDLIFNVNQNRPNDSTATILYYLGDTPPSTPLLSRSKVNSQPFGTDTLFALNNNIDSLTLSPQVLYYDSTEIDGIDTNFLWVGPNGFTDVGQTIVFNPITLADSGVFTVFYTTAFGCQDSMDFHVLVTTPINCDSTGTSLVPRAKIGVNAFIYDTSFVLTDGFDTLLLSPQIQLADSSITNGVDSNFLWVGPNSFTHTGREINFAAVTASDSGTYMVTYTDSLGCEYSINLHLTVNPFDCDSTGTSLLPRAKIGGNAFTNDTSLMLVDGSASLLLSPQILLADSSITNGVDSNFQWIGPNNYTHSGREISFTPVTISDSGTYMVLYTDSLGCEYRINFHLSVNPFDCDSTGTSLLPRAKIGGNTFTDDTSLALIDDFDTLLLSPQIQLADSSISNGVDSNFHWLGPNSFTQSGREISFTPISFSDTGTYTVSYSDSLGCEYSINFHLAVYPFDCDSNNNTLLSRSQKNSEAFTYDPNISAIEHLDSILFNPLVMQADSSTSTGIENNYSWTGPNNFTYTGREVSFTPVNMTDQGTYFVVYTDTLGCQDSTRYFLTVVADSNDLSLPKKVKPCFMLNPNPTSGIFTISDISQHTLIYDANGKLVLEFTKPQSDFDISNLANGQYSVVMLSSSGESGMCKVVKKVIDSPIL